MFCIFEGQLVQVLFLGILVCDLILYLELHLDLNNVFVVNWKDKSSEG